MLLSNRIKLEEQPYELIPDATVLDLLYSQKRDHLKVFLNQGGEQEAKRILKNTPQYWINLLNETQSSPRILLLAYPSANYSRELLSNETARVQKQADSLGPEKLESAAGRLEEAIQNQVFPPNSVLESIPFANVSSISYRKLNYHNYTTMGGWENGHSFKEPIGNKLADRFDLKAIPFRFHFDDINSQFVRIYVFLDMSNISDEDKMYAVLLTQLWLESPLRNGSTVTTLEETLQTRSREALSFYNDLGYKGSTYTPGSQSNLQMFYIEAKMEKYERVVLLLKEALFNVEFTTDRAQSIISQLLNRIPSMKQSASTVVTAIYDNIYFGNETFIHSASFLRQANFLRGLI